MRWYMRVFFEPFVVLASKHLPATAAHTIVHFLNAGFDRHAAVFEGRVLVHHVQAGVLILAREGNAGAGECLIPSIVRPGPAQPPVPHGLDMLQRRLVPQPKSADQIQDIHIPVPPHLHERRRMVPAEVAAAQLHPMARA